MCLEKILGIKGASVPLPLSLSFFLSSATRGNISRWQFSLAHCLFTSEARGKAFWFNSQFPSREGGEEGEMFETWLADRNFGGFVNLDLTSIFFSTFDKLNFSRMISRVKFENLFNSKNILRLLTSGGTLV